MQEIENINNAIGRGQQAHLDLQNKFTEYKVNTLKERHKLQYDINELFTDFTNYKSRMASVIKGMQDDIDTLTEGTSKALDEVKKLEPKGGLFKRLFGR